MNFKKYHVSKNLFDASTAYGVLYNNGVISGELTALAAIKNAFPAELIGKQVTISVTADAIQSNRAYIRCSIDGSNVDSNAITQGNTGTLTVTITPTSTSDKWWLTYGSGTGSNTFSNLMLNTGSTPLPYEPYSSEVWHDTPHYIHNTSTDTLINLPAVLYPNDTTATVELKGNTVQNGTPTPSNPVDVNGVGERTENLFDGSTSATNQRLSTSGTGTYGAKGYSVSSFIKIEPSTYYTITTGETTYYNLYNENKQYIYGAATNKRIPDSYANARYIRFDFKTENIPSVMLVKGSTTPSAHEPYGYKIPISSAGQTNNIYLGEVETTRRIKKFVFNGTEDWGNSVASDLFGVGNLFGNTPFIPQVLALCTEYTYNSRQGGYANGLASGEFALQKFTNGARDLFSPYFRNNNYTTVDQWKAYLQQQYAAGTPVTIWYVLATEETAVVNEPLMRIDNYADTVSNVSIPVTAGGDTLSVDTTIPPSEVTVNYKGWHPLQSVHEYDSNYTIATMQTLTIAQLQTHTISELQGGEWL